MLAGDEVLPTRHERAEGSVGERGNAGVRNMSMSTRARTRRFWIVVLVLSSIWVAATFFPLLYGALTPAPDFLAIITALRAGTGFSLEAPTAVQETISAAGPLFGLVSKEGSSSPRDRTHREG